jgi:hypothetical protein
MLMILERSSFPKDSNAPETLNTSKSIRKVYHCNYVPSLAPLKRFTIMRPDGLEETARRQNPFNIQKAGGADTSS